MLRGLYMLTFFFHNCLKLLYMSFERDLVLQTLVKGDRIIVIYFIFFLFNE